MAVGAVNEEGAVELETLMTRICPPSRAPIAGETAHPLGELSGG
jgi:hypothetical protein